MLKVFGAAQVSFPTWVLGAVFVLLIAGALFGTRIPRYGGWVTAACFLLLLAPFLTIPWGNHLIRVAELSRRGPPSSLLPLGDDGDNGRRVRRSDCLPDRVLPRVRDQEIEVHVAADRDRAVPDELPAAHLCLEDHPRQSGDPQLRALRRWRRSGPSTTFSSTASSPSSWCSSTPGCRSSSCRSSSRSRTSIAACSKLQPISVRAA